MIPPLESLPPSADSRLDEVASLLARGILRAHLRRRIKAIPRRGTTEIRLEVSALSSAPVLGESQKGAS